MKQKGASCRILLRCGLLILTLGILLCGAVRSFGESEPPGNAFDMEEQLIIPTNKTQITLRTGPGFFYPVKQTLTECEKLEVLEKGLWYKVQYEGTSGYVYSALFVDEEGFAANRLDGAYIGFDFAASYNAHSIGLGTQVNIALANLLKAALEEAGATVIMPRTDIGGEELQSDIVRAEIFNKYDCDIIYHFDTGAEPSQTMSGPHICLTPDSGLERAAEILSADLRALAGKEGSDVREQTADAFLNHVKSPVMLIVPGYITSDQDWKLFGDEAYRNNIAVRIREFTVDYIYEYKLDGGSATGDL